MPEPPRIVGAVVLIAWATYMLKGKRISFGGEGLALPEGRSWMPIWRNALDWLVSTPLVIICLMMIFLPKTGWPGLGHLPLGLGVAMFILLWVVPIRAFFFRRAFGVMDANRAFAQRERATYRDKFEPANMRAWLYSFRGYVALDDGVWLGLTVAPRVHSQSATQVVACGVAVEPRDPNANLVWNGQETTTPLQRTVAQAVARQPGIEKRLAYVRIREGGLHVLTRPYRTPDEAASLVAFTRRLVDELEQAGVIYPRTEGPPT